jgi:hypothetical protein
MTFGHIGRDHYQEWRKVLGSGLGLAWDQERKKNVISFGINN